MKIYDATHHSFGRWQGDAEELSLARQCPSIENITEQVSIIEQERMITTDILQKYLPYNEVGMLPVSVSQIQGREHKLFANEREILYQVLFDMKKDITDLKQAVKSIMKDSSHVQHSASFDSSSSDIHQSSIITNDNKRVSVPMKYEVVPQNIH